MTRKKQIFDKSVEYVEIYSRSIPIEFRNPINSHVEKAFIAGSEWADGTILKEVLKWLDKNFYEHELFSFDFVEDSPYECPIICDFESKEQMLQSFKEQFNIE